MNTAKLNNIFQFIPFLCLLWTCHPPQNPASNTTQHEQIKSLSELYDFNQPDKIFVLNNQLAEISGLSYSNAESQLLAINDEEGIVFKLDPNNGKIITQNNFAKRGDYEGIAYHEGLTYITKSNGDIYIHSLKTGKTTKIKTSLKDKNNVEGLCFEHSKSQLLIACKGAPHLPKSDTKSKTIVAYNLNKKSIDPSGLIQIDIDSLIAFSMKSSTLKTKFKQNNIKSKLKSFSPSGIAIHPESNDYYILSAKGSILLILNNQKVIKDVILLNTQTLPQPEGITFDNNNNLYISTEGQGFSGKIFKYSQHED